MIILPEDLIQEILLRLPVRSLLRFKCVCKSWHSIVSNPQFAKFHFDLAAEPTNRLLLRFSQGSKAKSIDIEAPLHDESTSVVLNIPLPPLALNYRCWTRIAGSCRGFILLTDELLDFFFDFVIWNPSTGYHKRINNVPMYPDLCGFGYDSSNDDYVVVNMSPSHGLFLNGALHWLVVKSHDNTGVIVAFDVMEKKLTEISLPRDVAVASKSKFYRLRIMGGCVCICFKGYRTPMLELWMMKKYKVQSSWTKSFVRFTDHYHSFSTFTPICFTQNGEILGSDDAKTLRKLNDKGELLEHRTHGLETRRFDGLLHCGLYRESLLTLSGSN
ncbi:F-box/kelch-repeat protein, partial [Mucuna pruriens]